MCICAEKGTLTAMGRRAGKRRLEDRLEVHGAFQTKDIGCWSLESGR